MIQNNHEVQRILEAYASAVKSEDRILISSFYTKDGVFLPDGARILSAHDIAGTGRNSFPKTGYDIKYVIQDLVMAGGLAFVTAQATVIATDKKTGRLSCRTSRDFFVLREEENRWRIFRYIFNHVKHGTV